jgi:hypothetical protein
MPNPGLFDSQILVLLFKLTLFCLFEVLEFCIHGSYLLGKYSLSLSYNPTQTLFFFVVLGLELRAYTLNYSTSPFL